MTDIVFKGVRMVQGNPLEKQTKDFEGNPIVDRKTNQLSQRYFFAVAISKNDPQWLEAHTIMQQVAQAGFPGGQANLPNFSWKFVDGDDSKYASKEGFPGHWVLRCSQTPPIKVCRKSGPGRYEDIVDKSQCPTGYYVNVLISIVANGHATNFGNYVNPRLVEVVAAGEVILGGPNPEDAFGGDPANLPVGANALPMPTPAALPMPTPAALPTPVPATAPVIVHQMTAKTGGATYEQMIEAGWTDEKMLAEGYMINTQEGVTPSPTILNNGV